MHINRLTKIILFTGAIFSAKGIYKLVESNNSKEEARIKSVENYDYVGIEVLSRELNALPKDDRDSKIGNDLHRITLNNRPAYATVEEYELLRNRLSGKQNNNFNPGDTVKYPIYFKEK